MCCFEPQEHRLVSAFPRVDFHVIIPPMSGVAQGVGPRVSTSGMWLGDVKYDITSADIERGMMVGVYNRRTAVDMELKLSENKHDLSLVYELSDFEACAGQVVLRITRYYAPSRTITVVFTAPDTHNKLSGGVKHSVNPFFSVAHQDAYTFKLSHEGPLRQVQGRYKAGDLIIHLRCPDTVIPS